MILLQYAAKIGAVSCWTDLSRHAVCRGCEEWMTLEMGPLEGNKGLGRYPVISSDAVRRVNVGGVQTLQFLNLDGL